MEINAENLEAKEKLVAVDVTAQVGDRLMSEEEFAKRDAERGVDAAGEPVAAPVEEKVLTATQALIKAAIERDLGYFEKTMNQRDPEHEGRTGSTFERRMTAKDLIEAEWERFIHPDILSFATAFKARIPGTVGVVDLASLPSGTDVRLVDPKDTSGSPGGGLTAEVYLTPEQKQDLKADFSVLILGPVSETDPTLTFWTVFPGMPIPAPRENPKYKNQIMGSERAIELWYRWAKVVETPFSK